MRSNKPIKIWVDPLFKRELKVCAASSGMSVINFTRKLAVDKKLVLNNDEVRGDDVVRY